MDYSAFIASFLSAVLSTLVMSLMVRVNLRRKDLALAEADGVIKPDPTHYVGTAALVFGVAAAGYGVYHSYMTFLYERMYIFAPLAIALGVVGWACLCCAWDRACQVRWNATTMAGPANYGFYPFGPRYSTIDFDQIDGIGTDWCDAIVVWDAQGNKIRWSYLYKGFAVLNDLIAEKRPDLFEPWEGEDD